MQQGMSRVMTLVFSVACGIMVANLYYAQALIGEIAPALGMAGGEAGFLVTLTQLGYGAGLILIVSLADLVENRRLVLTIMAGAVVGLVGLFFAASAPVFLVFAFITGFCSVGAQVLVPLAAHLSAAETRGRVVGEIMAGLFAGVMLARPVANGLAALGGWRTVFAVAAVAMMGLMLLLMRMLPRRRPESGLHYGQILVTNVALLFNEPLVRRRALYQAALFAAFNVFWTTIPLVLHSRFGLGQVGIGLFALAGAGGALVSPLAGRLGDRGFLKGGTALAMMFALGAFAVAGWSGVAQILIVLAVAAIVLDASVQFNHVLAQSALYALNPAARGRINAIYLTTMFIGGAAGSASGAAAYAYGGWAAAMGLGAGLAATALAYFLTEPRTRRPEGG